MTVFVNREDLIATLENFFLKTTKDSIDKFLAEGHSYFYDEGYTTFFGLVRIPTKLRLYVQDSRRFQNFINTHQTKCLQDVYKRAKSLSSEWIPISEEELENILDWWIPTTRFLTDLKCNGCTPP